MPKVTRSIEEVDAVRNKILDYTFKILVKSGYEGLSMAKIASKMKMTAANLYNYFGSKDELLIAIHKKAYAMLYEKISYVVEMAATPLQRYKSMAYAFVDFGISNANIYDIMFNRPVLQYSDYVGTPLEEQSSDEFRTSLKVFFLSIKVIREYRESRPELEPVDPRLLAIQSTSALHGIISLHNSGMFYQITDDPEMVLNALIDRAIACVIK
jgi:AcrR family transcriptional regulator